jgi:uncharacterized Zn finger protein (UPF0148 family)
VLTGHCSHCGKIWTLETGQGVCQWCGQLAVCQSSTAKPRHIKSSRRRKQRQAQTHDNGYSQLDGEWLTYYQVASRFSHKAQAQDREDLLHNIIVTLADVARNNGHKPITEVAMYRVASVTVADYWRSQYKLTNGLDCGSCSKAQRRKCRSEDLYSECPKAIKLEYLSQPITDDDGNLTELGELIADDKTIDLADWLDAKTFLRGCPQRLIEIAHKITDGQKLTATDSQYLWRYRKREQKPLIPM